MNDSTHFNLVGEFHETFDYSVRKEPFFAVFENEPNLVKSRSGFMWEENAEFKEAYANSDMKEMADALCDMAYFGHGTGQCLGINVDQRLEDRGLGYITCRPTPKSDDCFDTNVYCDFITEHRSEIDVWIAKLDESLNMFDRMSRDKDFEGLADALVTILINTYSFGYFLHFDMDRMFREVHRSNMTKVCHNLEDAEESVKLYNKEGRYNKPVIRMKGPYFMVYDEDLNKILKNHKWENPNLYQFMGSEFA